MLKGVLNERAKDDAGKGSNTEDTERAQRALIEEKSGVAEVRILKRLVKRPCLFIRSIKRNSNLLRVTPCRRGRIVTYSAAKNVCASAGERLPGCWG